MLKSERTETQPPRLIHFVKVTSFLRWKCLSPSFRRPQRSTELTPKSRQCSDFRFPTSDFRFPNSHFRLPTSDFPLPISEFPLPISDFRIPTSKFRFPTSDFRFPISDFRLPTRPRYEDGPPPPLQLQIPLLHRLRHQLHHIRYLKLPAQVPGMGMNGGLLIVQLLSDLLGR